MKNQGPECTSSKRMWSKEEDDLLIGIVDFKTSRSWIFISQEFNQLAQKSISTEHIMRTNKQCRERWQNHLNPQLNNKTPWSEEQHRALFELFTQHSHQWCQLASKLQNRGFLRRGENNIKNYFYTAIKRQIKKMNEIIKQNNKQTKKNKSQINKSNSKYSYNPRYSLQRQILSQMAQYKSQNLNIYSSSPSSFPRDVTSMEQLFCNRTSINQQASNFHIIKQLDYNLISKILLIAQEKANKKYIISERQNHQLLEAAQKLRYEFIQLMMEKQQTLDKQRVKQLSTNMLKISRRCKKKKNKTDDAQQLYFEQSNTSSKNRINIIAECKTASNLKNPTSLSQIGKFFRQEQPKSKKNYLEEKKNNPQSKDQQNCFQSIFNKKLSLNDAKLNNDQILYPNFSDTLFRNKSNDKVQNLFENKICSFLKSLRDQDQPIYNQYPIIPNIETQNLNFLQISNHFQQQGNTIRSSGRPSLLESICMKNSLSYENEGQHNYFCTNFIDPLIAFSRSSSADKNLQQMGQHYFRQT